MSVIDELVAKKKAEMLARSGSTTTTWVDTDLEGEEGLSTPIPKKKVAKKKAGHFDLPVPEFTGGSITYSQITGEKHPFETVDRVYPLPVCSWEHPEDIPEPDENWVPDHKTLPFTIACIAYGHNGFMFGPPGTGKTTDIREVCARMGIPYYRVNGMEGTEPSDYVGGVVPVDGTLEFKDGPIVQPVRTGGVLAFDEPFKVSSGTLMSMQWLAESGSDRSLMLYGHPDPDQVKLPAHSNFSMFLCDNVRGTGDGGEMFSATQLQDQSFINRMQYKIEKGYMSPDQEAKALEKSYPYISGEFCTKMVSLASLMRQAWSNGDIEIPFSFRELQVWAGGIKEFNGDWATALAVSYGNILNAEERTLFDNAIRDVGFSS